MQFSLAVKNRNKKGIISDALFIVDYVFYDS